jgi:hypothetical protein
MKTSTLLTSLLCGLLSLASNLAFSANSEDQTTPAEAPSIVVEHTTKHDYSKALDVVRQQLKDDG